MKKVYNKQGNYYKIYNKDCLIQMKKIKDKSIDLILCDLPYGTTNCSWDSIIPFNKLWKHYNRIIKDNGAIVLFGSEPFSSHLRMSNIEMYKYDWVWEKNKGSGFLLAKKKPLNNYENISVFYKEAGRYNPQMRYGYSKYSSKKGKKSDLYTGKQEIVVTTSDGSRYPVSILKYNKEIGFHPTQKPVALLEYLIKTYSNENDLVLDNTMGSGSTGVACINTKRNFIGMELNKKYYKIAKKRLNSSEMINNLSLF